MQTDEYVERIRQMENEELEQEWQKETGWRLEKVKHEMAMRFRGRAKQQKQQSERGYFMDKYLKMAEEFKEAYRKKDWFRAKHIYDNVVRIGCFLEIPQETQEKVFGCEEEDGTVITGIIPKELKDRVMNECIIKDRLGHECVVYRVPGEVGFYGARYLSGTRLMAAEENPACRAGKGG